MLAQQLTESQPCGWNNASNLKPSGGKFIHYDKYADSRRRNADGCCRVFREKSDSVRKKSVESFGGHFEGLFSHVNSNL